MNVNVFEGARRVRLLLQILLIGSCLAIGFFDHPYISTTFETLGPSQPWRLSDTECGADDKEKWKYDYYVGDGFTTSATLCFRADDDQLIPYERKEDYTLLDEPYSDTVEKYVEGRVASFSLPADEQKDILDVIRAEWWEKYLDNWKNLIMVAVVGSILLHVMAWAIGWIARGFMGIPSGSDQRVHIPKPTNE